MNSFDRANVVSKKLWTAYVVGKISYATWRRRSDVVSNWYFGINR